MRRPLLLHEGLRDAPRVLRGGVGCAVPFGGAADLPQSGLIRSCLTDRRRPESEQEAVWQGAEAMAYPQRYVEPKATQPDGFLLDRSQAIRQTGPRPIGTSSVTRVPLPLVE